MTNPAPTPAPLPGDWMENKQNLANGVHFLLALCLLLLTLIFAWAHTPWWLGGMQGLILTFFFGKEFWYDLKYETGETVKSSIEDYVGYCLGSVVFWLLFGLRIAVYHWVGH